MTNIQRYFLKTRNFPLFKSQISSDLQICDKECQVGLWTQDPDYIFSRSKQPLNSENTHYTATCKICSGHNFAPNYFLVESLLVLGVRLELCPAVVLVTDHQPHQLLDTQTRGDIAIQQNLQSWAKVNVSIRKSDIIISYTK